MGKRSAVWFRNVTIGGIALSLLMVPAMEWLQHEHLSPWLHLPLTFAVLNLMAGGGLVAGAALVEYRSRSAGSGQQA